MLSILILKSEGSTSPGLERTSKSEEFFVCMLSQLRECAIGIWWVESKDSVFCFHGTRRADFSLDYSQGFSSNLGCDGSASSDSSSSRCDVCVLLTLSVVICQFQMERAPKLLGC